MTRIRVIATATVMTLLLGSAVATAQQPDTRDRTIMTFSAPVELPGMRLEAGTYVFRLADTASRNVIQVLSQNEMEMLGQWLFIPAQRRDVTGETVVTFRETSANATPAVQYWYYPGESIGKEFIYPKDQAMRIAQRTGATVLTDDGPVSTGAQASAETQVAPAQEQGAVAVRGDDVGAVDGGGLPDAAQPVGTDGRSAQATTGSERQTDVARESAVQQDSTVARADAVDELPQTGSPLAMTGLLALLSLAGVAAFRRFRQ